MKKFKKQLKRYILVLTCLVSCVVIIAAPCHAASSQSFSFYSTGNVSNIFYANQSDVFVNFSEGLVNDKITLPLGLMYYNTNFSGLDQPILLTTRFSTSDLDQIRYQKYKVFDVNLKTIALGWRASGTPVMSSFKDDDFYALDFSLVFLSDKENEYAPDSFNPGSNTSFILYFRRDLNSSTLTGYNLEFKHEVEVTASRDEYDYYSFYCELPGYVIKGLDSLQITGYDVDGGYAYLQFGFPSRSGNVDLFKVSTFDLLNAPLYAQSFSNQFLSLEEVEDILKEKFIDTGIQSNQSNFLDFGQLLRTHRNSFLACTRAVNLFFEQTGVSSILIICVSAMAFVVLFRLGVGKSG